MMLFKLAFRNIVKSIRDYMIYFATLVLGVAVFYVFNALDSQTIMLAISNDTREIINVIMEAMSVVSVFVSFILGFLIVYASGFLMKRRKKEFGLYLLLGMGKGKVSGILLIETLYIGVLSLVAGLGLGVVASQGMSIVVANLFKADMTQFRFTVSGGAIAKTLIYFAVIFLVVIVFQTFMVGKNRLINLLNARKKAQKNYGKNPILCVVVFIIGAVLLGTAYYNVTVGFEDIFSLSDIGIEIIKGIVGTFAVFWSVSGFLIVVVKSNKKFYNKGLNCFTTKELSSRINTSVFAGGIISLLLFFTISILSCSVAVKNSMDKIIERKTPMDIQFTMSKPSAELTGETEVKDIFYYFNEYQIDMSDFKDMTCVQVYNDSTSNMAKYTLENATDYFVSPDQMWIPIIHVSDYNKLANIYGIDTCKVESGEYALVSDNSQAAKLYSQALETGKTIEFNGNTYTPAYKKCVDGFISMSNAENNMGVLVVADDADFSYVNFTDDFVVSNYNTEDETKKASMEEYYGDFEFWEKLNPGDGEHACIDISTRIGLVNGALGMSVLLVFVGLYLGIIFLISSGAILSLKELSEAADSKDKYKILRKIGVDEKQINRSLLSQSGVFFGLPLFIAIIHSIFGIQTALLILEVFGREGLFVSIFVSACIILGIYGIYFAITYTCSKKIISE